MTEGSQLIKDLNELKRKTHFLMLGLAVTITILVLFGILGLSSRNSCEKFQITAAGSGQGELLLYRLNTETGKVDGYALLPKNNASRVERLGLIGFIKMYSLTKENN